MKSSTNFLAKEEDKGYRHNEHGPEKYQLTTGVMQGGKAQHKSDDLVVSSMQSRGCLQRDTSAVCGGFLIVI